MWFRKRKKGTERDKLFREVSQLLRVYLIDSTFTDFLNQNDVSYYRSIKEIHVHNASNHRKMIGKLLGVGGIQLTHHYKGMDMMDFSLSLDAKETLACILNRESASLRYAKPCEEFGKVALFYKAKPTHNFLHLFDKYEDSLSILRDTLLELKEMGGELDKEEKEGIVAILSTFTEEVNSLQHAVSEGKELDVRAHRQSLKRRIQDEARLVKQNATDWGNIF